MNLNKPEEIIFDDSFFHKIKTKIQERPRFHSRKTTIIQKNLFKNGISSKGLNMIPIKAPISNIEYTNSKKKVLNKHIEKDLKKSLINDTINNEKVSNISKKYKKVSSKLKNLKRTTRKKSTKEKRNSKITRRLDVMVTPPMPIASQIEGNSIILEWPKLQKVGLKVEFLKIQYREIPARKKPLWHTITENLSPSTTSYIINKLRYGSGYIFRLTAVYSNKDNRHGPNSDKIMIQIASKLRPPSIEPLIVEVKALSPYSLSIKWEQMFDPQMQVDGFKILYRAFKNITSDYKENPIFNSISRSIIIQELTPSTSYILRIQSFNKDGLSPFSKEVVSKTKDFKNLERINRQYVQNELINISPVSFQAFKESSKNIDANEHKDEYQNSFSNTNFNYVNTFNIKYNDTDKLLLIEEMQYNQVFSFDNGEKKSLYNTLDSIVDKEETTTLFSDDHIQFKLFGNNTFPNYEYKAKVILNIKEQVFLIILCIFLCLILLCFITGFFMCLKLNCFSKNKFFKISNKTKK